MRGDVYELKAPRGTRGHEQRGRRYAVIVQSDDAPLSTWLVAPTSTSAQPALFRPEVQVNGKPTFVLVEQLAAVTPERLGRLVGHLRRNEITDVDDALRAILHLE